ncbi:hypothetical protein C2U72_00445 [Prosthecomicrobium hirschii]|nr:hypothetical protein C2U72_00445 [Prosthecomicrobium hirschii]
MWQMDGRRSMIPADLSHNDLDAIQCTLHTVADPEFQARVGDLLWLRRKDFKAARMAVAAYIEAGSRLEDPEHWPACMERYERGLRLARQIDAKGVLPKSVLAHLEARVRHYDGQDPLFFTCKALELLAEFQFGDFPALAETAGRAAAKSCEGGDFRRARSYFDVQAKLLKLAKDDEAAEAARVASAETHAQEAENREASGSFMAARSFWEDAVLAFRDRPSLRARIPELQRRLAIAGKKSLDDMKSISHEIDIRPMVEHAEAAFKGLALDDALCQLAVFEKPIDPVSIRHQTLKKLEETPLYAHIDAEIYDETGRKIGRRPSISSSDPKERESAIEGFIEQNASFIRGINVMGSFAPAVRTILTEHNVTEKEIEGLIADSGFIPEGRLPLFAKAIADGFRWDFSTALHVLVPQAENGLRYIIEQSGEVPRSLNQDGVEEVWSIERIMGNDRLKKALGASFAFDLQSLLSGRTGPNLRNNIAHGLVSSSSLNSPTGFYLWWLLFRLVVFPTSMMRAFRERHAIARDAEEHSED